MNDPKIVDFTKPFIANGNTYHRSEKICMERWIEFEKLSPRLTYGIGFEEMFKSLTKAYALLNKQQFADASVIIHNLLSGIKDATDDTRVHPSLLMCALVINREGEDTGVYNKEVQLSKIEDWTKEGLNVMPFFAFALQFIQGFKETYTEYISQSADLALKENQKQKK